MNAFLLCPGRGSYGKPELGALARSIGEIGDEARALVDQLESQRAALQPGMPSLHELDSAPSFRPALHLKGEHASAIIFACTLVDALRARRDSHPVLVGGNSLGFYSALVVSGAVSPSEGFRLVATMAELQQSERGGQVLWTLIDDDWRLVPDRQTTLNAVLDQIPSAALSIRLGGHVIVAANEEDMPALLDALPPVKVGKRDFPFRLAMHGPFHTDLLRDVADAGLTRLADLDIRAPEIPLIDGRGYLWSPLSSDPAALLHYTLVTQVTSTFDFTEAVRVGLLDYAPERIDLLGPGTSLRAPVGHILQHTGSPAKPWIGG